MRKFLAALLLTTLFVPALCGAATQASKDFEDQGLALFNKGLYAKSIEYFQDAVQADSSNWQAYEDLGNAYAQTNQNQNAIDAYQRSLQGNPNNQTVKDAITNLGGNPNAAPSGPAPQTSNQPAYNQGQPTEEVVVGRRGRRRVVEVDPVYKDNLAPINHAKFWVTGELFYNWSNQQDLFNSASSLNTYITQNPPDTGIATAYHDAIGAGAEFGFMLNPYNGLAIGVRGIQTNDYTSNINFNNGPPSDYETIRLTPYVVPLTLDYYLFLPDHDGRFFVTAGVGYYFADVRGDDNFNYTTGGGPTAPNDEYLGDMYGGSVGFQFGIGREFEISRHLGLRLFARGHYAKITNINGTFTSANGVPDQYGLVTFPAANGGYVGIDSTSHISAGGENYATLDYTGFDVGVGLTFF